MGTRFNVIAYNDQKRQRLERWALHNQPPFYAELKEYLDDPQSTKTKTEPHTSST